MNSISLAGGLAIALLSLSSARADGPEAIAAPGEFLVTTVHAEGAQVYACTADAAGRLAWQFREPIATLMADGKTVGRHFAGPHWEFDDGSKVSGKVVARADKAGGTDIPLLKLAATVQRAGGLLDGVTTILRLETVGGVAQGPCEAAGALKSVPYAADYAFYRKTRVSLAPSTRADEERRGGDDPRR